VLAPDHQELMDKDRKFPDLWKAAIDRPRDVTKVIDHAERLNAAGGALERMIDLRQVAVVGHSYGGYAALAAAGARYDLKAFNARCAALAADDPDRSQCSPHVPREEDMASRAGLARMPDGLWPSWGDPRVKAIVPPSGMGQTAIGLAHRGQSGAIPPSRPEASRRTMAADASTGWGRLISSMLSMSV